MIGQSNTLLNIVVTLIWIIQNQNNIKVNDAYYQVDLLSRYLRETICQLVYFLEIEKYERSDLEVESRHFDMKWIFNDFFKFVETELVKHG